MKVSVIVPAFNAANWIGATVQSLLAQTFGQWEMWLVDDGSTDSTLDEVRQYADARIHVISQPNAGQEMARLAGARQATGTHIVLMDADDLFLPTALQHLTEAAARQPGVIVHGDWAYVDAGGENPLFQSSIFRHGPGLKTLVYYNPCLSHCALIPRAFLDDSDSLPIDEAFLCDWCRWLRLALAGREFVHAPQLVALYRRHATGYSRDIARRKSQRLATLDDFWRDPRVPEALLILKASSYATAYVDLACDAWNNGEFEQAWQELMSGQNYDAALMARVDTIYRLLHAREGVSFSPALGMADVQWLWRQWQRDQPPSSEVQSALYATLGLVCYRHQHWSAARRFLGQALRTAPFWLQSQRKWLRPYLAAHVPSLLRLKRELSPRPT